MMTKDDQDTFHTLVVDDEQGIRFFLQETLEKEGHTVEAVSNGREALDRLRETGFDVVLLDLKLGGRVDGLRVLEAVRWRWPKAVVIILTAHGTLDSAVSAIEEGVDGYLLKPVEPDEVRRAVRDALKRREALAESEAEPEGEAGEPEHVLRSEPFVVDLRKHQARMNGEILDLTPREFRLLAHLMKNADRVVPPPELVRVVRGYECEDLYEARQIIKWYIHRLRRKVEEDSSSPEYILNVRGVGYRFKEMG